MPARVIEQARAVLGQLGGAPVARENRPIEALLQPLHLHRDGGLRLVHDLGGLGEAAGLGDGDEGAQLVDVEQGGHGAVLEKAGVNRPGGYIIKFLIGQIKNIRFTNQYPAAQYLALSRGIGWGFRVVSARASEEDGANDR